MPTDDDAVKARIESIKASVQSEPAKNALIAPVGNASPRPPFDELELRKHSVEPTFRVFANLVRICVKVFMVLYLLFIGSDVWFGATLLLIFTEILEWVVEILLRKNVLDNNSAAILSSVFSVTAISGYIYLGSLTLSDWFVLYFFHFTSATGRFKMIGALVSTSLSVISYSLLLFLSGVSLSTYYLRPLFLILVGWRMTKFGRLILDLYNERHRVLTLNKMKNDFIAIISHNLRTPIGILKGYIELMGRSDTGPLNADQTDIIERMKSNNKRLEEVSEEIISLSILENKTYNVIRSPQNYIDLVKEVYEENKILAEKKKIGWAIHLPEETLPQVNMDREKLKTVLVNLVDNAVKFTNSGSVGIYVSREGDFIITKVEDTGIGIPKDQLTELFEKFHRVGSVLVYDFKGAGLGLYIAKTIVGLHDGKIWAESTEGKGTKIYFSLPALKLK